MQYQMQARTATNVEGLVRLVRSFAPFAASGQVSSRFLAAGVRRVRGIEPHSSYKSKRLTLDLALHRLKQKSPREFVFTRDARIASCPTGKRPNNFVVSASALTSQFAECLIAMVICPNSTANRAAQSIGEHDSFCAEAHRGPGAAA